MILIASGAYLQDEFVSELGLLPPSFLPIGNKRLYEYQFTFLELCSTTKEDFYLSIPYSYALDDYDKVRLKQLGIEIIRVPEGLSLGNSLLYCWNATAKHYKSFTLLHGDTLFLNGSFNGSNEISIHLNQGFYERASLGKELASLEHISDGWSDDCEQVVSGFFRFSEPLYFMKSLVEAKSDFIQAIVSYQQAHPVLLVSNGDWLDFGHINSFYHSRTHMTTQRVFNSLSISRRSVYKSSKTKSKKIYAEGNWFANLPMQLRSYTPALLDLSSAQNDYSNSYYELEYLYLLPLSDLFVFSRVNIASWQIIFAEIVRMLSDFKRFRPQTITKAELEQVDQLYLPKTLERLESYANQERVDLEKNLVTLKDNRKISLMDIALQSAKFIEKTRVEDIAISHGDLCFSNILYDHRAEAIKCIDPRGITSSGELSVYGDRRYDLAKLYHSTVGLYDFIITGRFDKKNNEPCNEKRSALYTQDYHQKIVDSFKKIILNKFDYSEQEILAINVHLFLSMLPLHSDFPSRQQAFITNAVRLFEKLTEVK